MKYIDADKLIAEIKRRMKINNWDESEGSDVAFSEDKKILSFIESMEKEPEVVELEKEIDRVFFEGDCGSQRLTHKEIAQIARHFWNKGYSARKEESK